MMSEIFLSFSFSATPLFIFITIYSIVIIGINMIIFYAKKYNINYNYFPTISEMNVFLPQSIMFSVAMTIDSFLLMTNFYFKNKIINSFSQNSRGFWLIPFCVLSFLGMVGFGCFPCKYYLDIHNACAATFFLSCDIGFILMDIFDSKIGFKPSIYSFFLSIGAGLFFIICVLLLKINDNTTQRSISTVFEILAILCFAIKSSLLPQKMESNIIVMTLK
jgi:hypothetical protein